MTADEARTWARDAAMGELFQATCSPEFVRLQAECARVEPGRELLALNDRIEAAFWHEVRADPAEAERWIAGEATRWPVALARRWDVAMALAWIMTLNTGIVRAINADPSRAARAAVLADAARPQHRAELRRNPKWAKDELRDALTEGGLVAEGRRPGQTTYRPIPPEEWRSLEWSFGDGCDRALDSCTVRYEGLRLDPARVVGLWKPEAAQGATQLAAIMPASPLTRADKLANAGTNNRIPLRLFPFAEKGLQLIKNREAENANQAALKLVDEARETGAVRKNTKEDSVQNRLARAINELARNRGIG